ncbi:MAG: hypothetical protein Aureis2KO_20290 [Aureisphaera sp.]
MCRESIENQTYKNVRHIVSYDNDKDLDYLKDYTGVDVVKVTPISKAPQNAGKRANFKFAPYNLYCNTLLNEVDSGWVLFLDDDDRFIDSSALEDIVGHIRNASRNTIILWQMRYPDGKVLPPQDHMAREMIKLSHIGAPCFTFHSKHKDKAKWDCWKAGDFFFLKQLFKQIKKKVWITKPYIQLNNSGNFGKREDIEISD